MMVGHVRALDSVLGGNVNKEKGQDPTRPCVCLKEEAPKNAPTYANTFARAYPARPKTTMMYTAQAATTSPPSEDDFSISGSYVISHLLPLGFPVSGTSLALRLVSITSVGQNNDLRL